MSRSWLHACVWAVRHWRGTYLPVEARALVRLLNPHDVAIDVGAHAGSWTVPLSRSLWKGKVIAIEALPYYAVTLHKLLTLMWCRNVTLINSAVTVAPCEVRMVWKDTEGQRLTGLTHVAAPDELAPDMIAVRGMPLDDLVARDLKVAFIKVDVEGAELGVFEGGRRTLETSRPMVFSEISASNLARYGHGPDNILEFFGKLDYRQLVFDSEGRWKAFTDFKKTGKGDALFVPAEHSLVSSGAIG